jgi:hypothetical protein
VALDDWKNQGHRTVWYDSRFYRLNMLWEEDAFFIRDIHCFDEHLVSPTHEAALKANNLVYETLPVVYWAFWSRTGSARAGMWPVLEGADGAVSPMQPAGVPVVKELNPTDLTIQQHLKNGGLFSIVCDEKHVTFIGLGGQGQPLKWAYQIVGGAQLKSMVKEVRAASVVYSYSGVDYQLKLGSQAGSCRQLEDGSIQLVPNDAGKLILQFDTSNVAAVAGNHNSTASNN